eukprot:gene10858-7524_t
MSADPNNTKWSKSANSFGRNLLQKSGWTEGDGLGKDQEGVKHHVKVSKKDDVMGLGYQAGVGETWSAQSVGFADVLDRIKSKVVMDDSDEDGGAPVVSPASSSPANPVGSKYHTMYAKRNALKTEGLQSGKSVSKNEILGHTAGKRSRSGTQSSLSVDGESTLQSSTLKRLMVRCPEAEPRPLGEDSTVDRVVVTKPHPRPPKCTETPFLGA